MSIWMAEAMSETSVDERARTVWVLWIAGMAGEEEGSVVTGCLGAFIHFASCKLL